MDDSFPNIEIKTRIWCASALSAVMISLFATAYYNMHVDVKNDGMTYDAACGISSAEHMNIMMHRFLPEASNNEPRHDRGFVDEVVSPACRYMYDISGRGSREVLRRRNHDQPISGIASQSDRYRNSVLPVREGSNVGSTDGSPVRQIDDGPALNGNDDFSMRVDLIDKCRTVSRVDEYTSRCSEGPIGIHISNTMINSITSGLYNGSVPGYHLERAYSDKYNAFDRISMHVPASRYTNYTWRLRNGHSYIWLALQIGEMNKINAFSIYRR